jgi:hypothetical protein
VPFPVEADGQMLWRALALRRREWELLRNRIDEGWRTCLEGTLG